MSIGRYIEQFFWIDSRGWGSGNIPNGISASLAQGDLILFEPCPQLRRTVETHKMYLNILPCSSMKVAACILIGDICDLPHLFGRDPAQRKLNAHHLHAGLTLAIDTPHQSQTSEFIMIDFSFAEKSDLFFQVDDIPGYNRIVQIFKFSAKALHVSLG